MSLPPGQPAATSPDESKYVKYSIAYSSASNTGWMNYYFWMEIYAWLYYLILGGILMFSSMPSLKVMNIGLWFGPHVLFPVGFISVIFFVGPPPYNLKQIQLMRHKVHVVYAFISGLLCAGSTIAFVVVQSIYVASAECSADPASICQGKIPLFVFLVGLCVALVTIAGLAIATVVMSWHAKKGE